MNWGKQETFDQLKAAVMEQGSYDEVYKVVRQDVLPILYYKGFSVHDADEILQEIFIGIMLGAVNYLKKSENYTEKQRNAWLRSVIKSKVVDFLRDYYRRQKLSSRLLDKAEESMPVTGNMVVSTDTAAGTVDIPDPRDPFVNLEAAPEKLTALLNGLFALRTTPDKLIAFVYNKIICDDYRGIITYKTAYISKVFHGKEVGLLALTVKPQLQLSLNISLTDEAVQPLFDKLKHPDKNHDNILFEKAPFTLTPRQITDSSNFIMNKFAEVVKDVNKQFE